ncbi:DUF6438 domain-containing protein [Trichocoleus sp. FACHB-262]|uniref:DUF6438 domain-containing protein n=1 Tax=Trichocoleus sp. FACHB-262 TaxID=2692869 RepID=UPI001687849B|nr:DUF6438 domain-containing protein [Trichocoleus sp. FACHB-262]MBD2121113.1 hypothetical protein [Trichocoleus sp. FACHB-262]
MQFPMFLSLGLLLALSPNALATSAAMSPFLIADDSTLSAQLFSQPRRGVRQSVVTLERTACFGFCPMYKLTIYADGRVIYEGNQFVKVKGIKTTRISPLKARQLMLEFQRMQYFNLQDRYEGGPTDAPSAITSFQMGRRFKTVHHYLASPDAPQTLTDLEAKIDATVNVQQWIGLDAIINVHHVDWDGK